MIEITGFASDVGPLTKRIKLAADGSLISDGSACVMSRGDARRLRFATFTDFATHIGNLGSHEAIALGSLRAGLPDRVEVATAGKIASLNGHAPDDLIARTSGYIHYRPQQTAAALLDYDTKGMPGDVAARLKDAGGFWAALVTVVPALEHAERAVRPSTSSGIARDDTGEALRGSDGVHVYLHIRDGGDTERFLKTLHDRCWLTGLGWLMIGAGGQFLERSIVDRMVSAGERLVFEGAPVLEKPLSQRSRVPEVLGIEVIDTASACRTLTQVETSELQRLKGIERHRLAPAATKERMGFVAEHSARLAAKTGGSLGRATYAVRQLCEKGVLLPSVELVFDDAELGTVTVADALADPERFVGATLADPLEGVAYGKCKAKIMQNADLSLFVNSFAHGHATYSLKLDAVTVEEAIRKVNPADAHEELATRLLQADLTTADEKKLRTLASELSGVKPKEIDDTIKQAWSKKARARREEAETKASAMRTDRRVRLDVPQPTSERTPVSEAIDEVLLRVREPEPPFRDMEGRLCEVRERPPMMMHTLTSSGANRAESKGTTRLPAPSLPLLTVHDDISFAYVLERHIEYYQQPQRKGSPGGAVALPTPFIKSYMGYRDSALPRVAAVVTAPLVMDDGTLLAPNGLQRDMQTIFRIPPEVRAVLPKPADPKPTAEQVRNALSFLVDEWLVDVAGDYRAKITLIAVGLTILERTLLAERPAFFVTASKRGGGKTTALAMMILAVTGKKPAAAAWSASEEERRKALLGYLSEGVGSITFDNIPLGEAVTCKTIEAILTAETYSDRVLGHTENRTVPALTVITFTGNNVHPKGDMASRSLIVRLNIERADPENRPFRHSDPIAWTLDNRGKILRAMYVVMLGNPELGTTTLRSKKKQQGQTRFKRWWLLVGSALSHAAKLVVEHQAEITGRKEKLAEYVMPATEIDFGQQFRETEADDEDTTDLVDVLTALENEFAADGKQTDSFQAKDIAEKIAVPLTEGAKIIRSFFTPPGKTAPPVVTSKMVGYRITAILDTPVEVRDECPISDGPDRGAAGIRTRTIKLARTQVANQASQRHTATFRVEVIGKPTYERIPEAKGPETKDQVSEESAPFAGGKSQAKGPEAKGLHPSLEASNLGLAANDEEPWW